MTVGALTPDADEARRLLDEELSKRIYVEARPNLAERIVEDLLRAIGRLLDGLGALGPGPGTVVLLLGAGIVVVLAVILVRPRADPRGARAEPDVFIGDVRRSAAGHRSRAVDRAAAEQWNEAIAELLRAIIRSAEERVLVDEQPGRTASEAAAQLGGVFPALAGEVAWLAELFNETHYGRGTASDQQYRRAAEVDARFSAHPVRGAAAESPAAPR